MLHVPLCLFNETNRLLNSVFSVYLINANQGKLQFMLPCHRANGWGGGGWHSDQQCIPIPPLLHTSRSLKPAGQHETAPATLPKACKPLPSGHLTPLVLFALRLRHDPGDHTKPMARQKARECPSLHTAAAWASSRCSLMGRKGEWKPAFGSRQEQSKP